MWWAVNCSVDPMTAIHDDFLDRVTQEKADARSRIAYNVHKLQIRTTISSIIELHLLVMALI